MIHPVFAAEISHENAPINIREKFVSNDETIKLSLKELLRYYDEVFILSTNYSYTVYVVGESINHLENFLAKHPFAKGYTQFYYNTTDTVTHLFATATGMLFPFRGRNYILTRIKHAYCLAFEADAIGGVLHSLISQATQVGQKIRKQSGIDQHSSSILEAGFSLLYEKLTNIYKRKFLVIGTGKIARLALQYLQHEGVEDITIVSQDYQACKFVADNYGAKPIVVEEIPLYFEQADVIIGASDIDNIYPDFVTDNITISSEPNTEVTKKIVLDFGMPLALSNEFKKYSAIKCYCVEDLKLMHNNHLIDFNKLDDAWKMVVSESKEFLPVLQQLSLSPILSAYFTGLLSSQESSTNLVSKPDESSVQNTAQISQNVQKFLRGVSFAPEKTYRSLENNLRAENPHLVVKNLKGFSYQQFKFFYN